MAPRPPIPVPDTYEAELVFKLGSVFMCNRLFYVASPGSYTPGREADIGTSLLNFVSVWYLNAISQEVTFEKVRVRDVSSTYGPWIVGSAGGAPGRAVDLAMSANVSMRVRSNSPAGNVRWRGAFQTVGVPRFGVDENKFTDAYVTAIVDAWSNAYDLPFASGYNWAWVSFRQGNAWRSNGITNLWGILDPVLTVSPRRRRLRNTRTL